MTTNPRWPPFAETCDEIEQELQSHGTRLLEMVCDSPSYDEATRTQLVSNVPAWATDLESLKKIYTRTIELRAKKHPKCHQAAFIASHRPIARIPCIQVHVEKIRPNIGESDLMLRKEAFGRRAYGLRLFNIGYGFRYSKIQERETFGCLSLRICLYDDTVASCGLGSSSGPYNVQTPLLPDCDAAVAQWRAFADQGVPMDSGLYNTCTWHSHLARWVPPILGDDAEFVFKVAHKYGLGILLALSDRLRHDEATVARLIHEGFDLSEGIGYSGAHVLLWTTNEALARLALGTPWCTNAWTRLAPEMRDKLGDVCPAAYSTLQYFEGCTRWTYAAPQLMATPEAAIACFYGDPEHLYKLSPDRFANAAKLSPPKEKLAWADNPDHSLPDYEGCPWQRVLLWVAYDNKTVVSHAGAMAKLAHHLTTTTLDVTSPFFHAKRLGAAMGAIPGLQRADVIDAMLERVEDVGGMKTVVDFALAFLDAVAKTDRVDRFTEAHVDRLGAIAAKLKSTKADSARAALIGRIVAAVENPARAAVKKRVRDDFEAFGEQVEKLARA